MKDAPEEELQRLSFEKGVNNIDSESAIPEGSARKAVNVDIDRDGWPKRRKGYTKKISLSNGHSLFSKGGLNLIVSAGYLNTFNPEDFALTPISSASSVMAYAAALDTIYCSDGVTIGRVQPSGVYQSVWVESPAGNPTVQSASLGSLQSGKYMVAITNISADGEESGTDISVPVELSSGGGIMITDIPQNADVAAVRIYITSTGGENFYRQLDLPMGLTTHTITSFKLGKELNTQFASQMPAGQSLCYHYGRLYVGVGGFIYYSEALRPGLTRLTDNYFPELGGDIKIMLSHTTGLFVVADKTYFLAGTNPEQMTVVMAYPHSGVKGTGVQVPSSILGIEEDPGNSPVWFSDNGLVAGKPGGVVLPLTEKQLAVDSYSSGAAMYREEEGIRSIVTSLQSPIELSKLASSDSVGFEVRRNGITIP